MTGDVTRLRAIDDVAPAVARPSYEPAAHAAGIVHIGLGAFHRAHQGVYTDDAMSANGGDWRIVGVSLRSTGIVDTLRAQACLYTVIVRDAAGTSARVVASLADALAAVRDRNAVLAAMSDPAIRIVTLTVTEKAYGIDRANGRIAEDHPAISADLSHPRMPSGVIGFLVEAIRRRRQAGTAPFTVLCCDNLPENGALLRSGVIDFATRADADLGQWIATQVAFPSSMVDRITPAPTAVTRSDARRLLGCRDDAAVETEPFRQWIIEDRFSSGRPTWEAGGAVFVEDVAPYERMKLRMLNGAHSLLAYAGHLSDCTYVRDAMRVPALVVLVERYLKAAAATLGPLEAIDTARYARSLLRRFGNPAIAHETYQIAMDGTEKLPQRILQAASEALNKGQDVGPFAFTVAAWMRYCLGHKDDGTNYPLRDPRADEIDAALHSVGHGASDMARALHLLPGLFPSRLTGDDLWQASVVKSLGTMLEHGMMRAIVNEAHRP